MPDLDLTPNETDAEWFGRFGYYSPDVHGPIRATGLTGGALLDAVADHVEAFPGCHDQGTWGETSDCGWTACTAGWAVLLHAGPVARPLVRGEMAPTLELRHLSPEIARSIVDSGRGLPPRRAGEAWTATVQTAAAHLLADGTNLSPSDLDVDDPAGPLFSQHWKPAPGLSVADALRLLARGATADEVTHAAAHARFVASRA